MEVEIPRDALVIRFDPRKPGRVLAWAKTTKRAYDNYRLSVFADAARQGETREQLIERLLRVAELSGIRKERNDSYFVCSEASELQDLQMTFHKDEYEGEPAEHYSVDVADTKGELPTLDDVSRFLRPFKMEVWP